MLWKAGSAVAAVLVLAFLFSYFGFRRNAPDIAGPKVEPLREIAMLDLRNASTPRSVQPSSPTSNQPQIELPRAVLSLTIQLPIGSEAGAYEVEIRKPNKSPNAAAKGQANIEAGITILIVDIDTSAISAGDYEFSWRMSDFDWRSYAVLIR